MSFFCAAVIVSAISGLLAIENLQAGQFTLSRPFFAGMLFGIICGCPAEGTALGIMFEIMYSAELPLGGAVPPNGLAGAASAVLAVKAGMYEPLALFYGIIFALAYSLADKLLRRIRSGWNDKADRQINSGRLCLNLWIIRSLAADFLAMFMAILAAGMAAAGLCQSFNMPFALEAGAKFVYFLIPAIGISMLYFRFKNNLRLYDYAELKNADEKMPDSLPEKGDIPICKVFSRLFLLQAGWNYGRLQNFGFLYSLMPFLRQTYKKDSELRAAMSRNFAKVNTCPFLGGLIASAAMRMERDYAAGALDLKRMEQLKSSLAASAATAGDGMFWARLKPVSLQIGLAACILSGFTHWLFSCDIIGRTVSPLKIFIGPAVSVLAFAVPACIMRWRSIKAGLCGNAENLLGLKLACPERLKFALDMLGFLFSIVMLLEVFIFFFIKSQQMDFSPRQTISRIVLILAMMLLGKYAGKQVSLQIAALILFAAALLISALGMPLYIF